MFSKLLNRFFESIGEAKTNISEIYKKFAILFLPKKWSEKIGLLTSKAESSGDD